MILYRSSTKTLSLEEAITDDVEDACRFATKLLKSFFGILTNRTRVQLTTEIHNTVSMMQKMGSVKRNYY